MRSAFSMGALGAAMLIATSSLAYAQSAGNAASVLGGGPAKVPNAATAPAGGAVTKGGRAVGVASGAHGAGPAPIVSGAVPETKPFTSGVTKGSGDVARGIRGTGSNLEGGATVSPDGAAKGVAAAPGNAGTQVKAAQGIVR